MPIETKKSAKHRFFRAVSFVGLVFFLSGASFVVIDKYLFPWLISAKWISKSGIFKKAAEDVVVVNKTEQVMVNEDQTISKYSNAAASSVAEIVSQKKKDAKIPGIRLSDDLKIGSGLIVTADGLVISHKNAIIAEKAEYKVLLADGSEYPAQLAAIDDFSELVVLKLENAENLPVPSFVSPEDIRVGAKAVAIGRSGMNAQIVFKSGLVSRQAKDFSIAGPLASSEKIQGVYFCDFDMSENGDENLAGGAIADYNGNIIGILGMQKTATGTATHYFVIPANYVSELTNKFIESGAVRRGVLGVYYQLLSKEQPFEALNGQKLESGALVYSPSGQQGLAVLAGSAAEKAGIRIFDVILAVNGEGVSADQNLARLVSKYKPGEEADLKIKRGKEEITLKAALH